MTISANIFKPGTTEANAVSPIIWSPDIIKTIYEKAVFPQLGKIDTRQLGVPGRQYNYTLDSAIETGILTPGVATPVQSLSFSNVSVVFYSYGGAVQIDEQQMAQELPSVLDSVNSGAYNSAIVNRDDVISTELYNTTSAGVYVNGTTSSTIAATDVLDTKTIVKLDTEMMQTQAGGCKAIVIHPKQAYSLRTDANFIDYSKNPVTAGTILRTGEIGSVGYQGVAVFVSNQITSATENGITVYKAIALGRNNPFVFMPKKNMQFYVEKETERERAYTFSWNEIFGTKILVNDSVVVVTSATGY
jgi:N4-gp56 family major capsid protein